MRVSSFTFVAVICFASGLCAESDTTLPSVQQAARKIDALLETHWRSQEVQPAELSKDAELLRRTTLDLVGRVPTTREVDDFLSDKSEEKRQRLVNRLINGPEFPLHFANVLDAIIQGQFAGNEQFVDYLRRSLRNRKTWDELFRVFLVGPWKDASQKAANRFVDKRAKNLDALTVDATRVFFGVDISCAKCHDHPLVDDWKQDHFYGMASFFNRTTGGKGQVGEKTSGEVKFLSEDGQEKTAQMMFLTGLVIDDAAQADNGHKSRVMSRRLQLVEAALAERTFFSRSFVNRVWEYLFGRGLVDPVDQMHSANRSSVAGLLEWLSADFSDSGYDVHRLVAAIASTRVYGLSSEWPDDSAIPAASHFAITRLRPLSRRQLALSMVMVTGASGFGMPDQATSRAERLLGVDGFARVRQYLALEQQAGSLIRSLDPRIREFQSSASEALFMSNNEAVQELIRPAGDNLTSRLLQLKSTEQIVETAVKTVLCRQPRAVELKQLSEWIDDRQGDRTEVCEQLVWALVASAEFRFNH